LTSLYLDSSALLKRYLEEEFSQQCEEIIIKYQDKYISQIGVTETLINLRKRLSAAEFAMAAKLFEADIAIFNILNSTRRPLIWLLR
jgi:PIN domain nuclease of toxin-antitoxin system